MRSPPLSPESILDLLAQGPQRIVDATRDISDELLFQRPEPGEWSIVELLTHLRASADVRGDRRIGRMLDEDEPTIRTLSPRHRSVTEGYLELSFSASLSAYAAQRERLLQRLRSLDPDDWQRGATLTGLGDRRHETVQSEADSLANHEASHIPQIERCAALLRTKN